MSLAHEGGVTALRRFASQRAVAPRCELCAGGLADVHEHLVEVGARTVVCACRSCAILFCDPAAGRHRRLAARAERMSGVTLDAEDFALLGVPVRLVYFLPSDVHDRLFALYPTVAGTTEAVLPRSLFAELAGKYPELASVQPDTEGLFVDQLGPHPTAHRVSLDVCYRLVGAWRSRGGSFPGVDALLSSLGGGPHA